MHRSLAACAAAALIAVPASSRAGKPGHTDVRAEVSADGDLIRLSTTWGDGAGAKLRVGKGKAIDLHDGDVVGTVTSGHGRVVVALAVVNDTEPFRVMTLDGAEVGEPATIARPVERHDLPFAVVATPTPDGFAVFFQEVEQGDPTAAHTYLVTLDDHGAPTGAATEVAVPWSLAAAAWNGDGFHLALIYSGDQRGMRLSMVQLSRDGQPAQHPDWASAGGFIADVHLVATAGKVRAFYRGGPNGDRLLESDVTAIGQWGNEPKKAKDRGGLPWSKVIAVDGKGRPTKVAGPSR